MFAPVQLPVAAKVPAASHAPGLVQVNPALAVMVHVVPTATLVAPDAQLAPPQLAAPPAVLIVGTVHVFAAGGHAWGGLSTARAAGAGSQCTAGALTRCSADDRGAASDTGQ